MSFLLAMTPNRHSELVAESTRFEFGRGKAQRSRRFAPSRVPTVGPQRITYCLGDHRGRQIPRQARNDGKVRRAAPKRSTT